MDIEDESWSNGATLMVWSLSLCPLKLMGRSVLGEDEGPVSAAWAMVAAHNSMARRGGYSPIQWVFGKDFTDADRLHDGLDLRFWSSLNTDEKFQKIAGMRERAKTKYKELMDLEKLSEAMNMKATSARAYHPGDLVYYKRHQVPAEGRSHQKLDVPRRQTSPSFGPTKVTYEGQVRQPHRLAWIISQGRLKRAHTDQLRHASECEKLTNEECHIELYCQTKEYASDKGQD